MRYETTDCSYDYTGRDYYALLRMAAIVKDVPEQNFSMEYYMMERSCGSVGCILGYYAASGEDKRFWMTECGLCTTTQTAGTEELRITENTWCWLFELWTNGTRQYLPKERRNIRVRKPDHAKSKAGAVARIHKFVRYMQRKDALMCGGTPEYEDARNSQGDLRIDQEMRVAG
jgi:hypothetical protein